MSNPAKKLVTHSGGFHTDDIFACATLQILLDQRGESYEVIRTRDPKIFATADYIFDVGREYDPSQNKFDHHQHGGAGERSTGIPYAAFGLVWKTYGVEVCGGNPTIADEIDRAIVQHIDGTDNGVDLLEKKVDIFFFDIQTITSNFLPTWKESRSQDEGFTEAVAWAKQFLQRFIQRATDAAEAEDIITAAYNNVEDKRFITIDQPIDTWNIFKVLTQYPEPLYFIRPNKENDGWHAVANRVSMETFASRQPFPESWRGLEGDDLITATGIDGAIFCHNAGFLCAMADKESAIKLINLVLTV
jgi:uncharacterized UPF0160 family protein